MASGKVCINENLFWVCFSYFFLSIWKTSSKCLYINNSECSAMNLVATFFKTNWKNFSLYVNVCHFLTIHLRVKAIFFFCFLIFTRFQYLSRMALLYTDLYSTTIVKKNEYLYHSCRPSDNRSYITLTSKAVLEKNLMSLQLSRFLNCLQAVPLNHLCLNIFHNTWAL